MKGEYSIRRPGEGRDPGRPLPQISSKGNDLPSFEKARAGGWVDPGLRRGDNRERQRDFFTSSEFATSRLQPSGDFAADSLQIATSETFYTNQGCSREPTNKVLPFTAPRC